MQMKGGKAGEAGIFTAALDHRVVLSLPFPFLCDQGIHLSVCAPLPPL